ncbi:MAG TPA: hypothetical protein VNJ53_12470, partial [Gaiellaceae bacterium]|nr:hypothetical protein [Gaiellaceae bacterium]
MNAAAARAALLEGKDLLAALRAESRRRAGPLGVSGVLAEQLARELGAGAEPGAVVVEPRSVRGLEVLVRIVAGDPNEQDLAAVAEADDVLVPVVLVQLWPQEDWTRPFVLTPFVVECRPGAGFPLGEIAARIADASEAAAALAARVPALRGTVTGGVAL